VDARAQAVCRKNHFAFIHKGFRVVKIPGKNSSGRKPLLKFKQAG
jgi:hypothetical protein